VHSKKAPFIMEIATNPGAIKLTYGTPSMAGIKPPKPNPKAKMYKIGSKSEGKKLTLMVFMKTSKFLLQTLQTLFVSCGIANFAGESIVLVNP
jgi:hypothetical protein